MSTLLDNSPDLINPPEKDDLFTGWWVDEKYGEVPQPKELFKESSVRQINIKFATLMGLFFVVAFAVRLIYIYNYRWDQQAGGDYFFYRIFATDLSHFHWPTIPGTSIPTASHPPMWSIILAVGDWLGLQTIREQIVINCFLGSVLVVVVGYIAKQIRSVNMGIIAALIGIFYPGFWVYDGTGLAEPTECLLVALCILVCYHYIKHPSFKKAILLGFLIGCTVLARSEQITLLAFMVLPVVLRVKGISLKKKFFSLIVVGLTTLATIAPWSIHVYTSFHHPEFLSTESGITLETANCYATYYGPFTGYWNYNCAENLPMPTGEAAADVYLRQVAIDFVKQHESRVPFVVLVRELRMFAIWNPSQQESLDTTEGWALIAAKLDTWVFWVMTPLALCGIVLLIRRKVPIAPLTSAIILTVLVAALIYGNQRYRASFEISWVILGSVTIEALLSRVRKVHIINRHSSFANKV